MSSSSHGKQKSSRRTSSSKDAPSSSAQYSQTAASSAAPIQVSASFLFHVNPQEVNEDPTTGIAPRVDTITGLWAPPLYRRGFGEQTQGAMYRWDNGVVSRSGIPSAAGLTPFRVVTMFFCNPFTQFLVTGGDASTRDMPTAAPPQDRWFPLAFHHGGTVSYLDFAGEYPYLAGSRAGFIRRIGLGSYQAREEDAPRAGGLAGNLAMLIALMAFSCRDRDLDAVLMRDRAWDYCQWSGHDYPHGYQDMRGLVVGVYLDPQNPYGSTEEILVSVECNMGAILK